MKFLRFPAKAIPAGPTKMASTFEVISPIPIFKITLILFKDVALNSGVRNMVLKRFKPSGFKIVLQNYY